jgi:serine/threonine protein kinase
LVDFGLARAPSGKGDITVMMTHTNNHSVAGTFMFMPLEQLKNQSLDFRTDVFAAGVTLYYLACKSYPHRQLCQSFGDALSQIESWTTNPPPPLEQRNPSIDVECARVIAKAIAVDPSARYQTANGMLNDLKLLIAPARMTSDGEVSAVGMMEVIEWESVVPTRSCATELVTNPAIRVKLPEIDSIVHDVQAKLAAISNAHPRPPVDLSDNQLFSIVGYTHQVSGAGPESSLYYQLNHQLRDRSGDQQQLLQVWGAYVYFMLTAMQLLPDFKGFVYRGFPGKSTVLEQYQVGRPIQWGAFTSTSKNFDATKGFTDQHTGVIFKIAVSSGKDINAYSFFPCEGEIVLSPNHRFTVSSTPYEKDGYTVIDMVQQKGRTWIS